MADTISDIFFSAMFITPLITIPIVWKRSKHKGFEKILIALALAIVLSVLFFLISVLLLEIPDQS